MRLLTAALAVFILAAPVQARSHLVCADRADVMAHLSKEWSEAVRGRGATNNGWLFEISRSENGKTWTATATLPNGMTCMMAAGEWWENIPRIILNGGTA